MTTPRVYLGRDQNMAGMVRVYLLPDALEVDETTFIEIERTRVYFDDVLAITYHRAYNWVLLAILGGFGTLFALIGATVLANDQPGGAAALFVFAAPFLLICVVHLILKTDIITVFGRRTMARMRFSIRKGRARQVHQQLIAKVRAHQAALAAAQPKPPPPAEPELPPGPPLPGVEPLPPAGPLL
jgi:hypothetical protein